MHLERMRYAYGVIRHYVFGRICLRSLRRRKARRDTHLGIKTAPENHEDAHATEPTRRLSHVRSTTKQHAPRAPSRIARQQHALRRHSTHTVTYTSSTKDAQDNTVFYTRRADHTTTTPRLVTIAGHAHDNTSRIPRQEDQQQIGARTHKSKTVRRGEPANWRRRDDFGIPRRACTSRSETPQGAARRASYPLISAPWPVSRWGA